MNRTLWHVYILQCKDGSLYTGISTDVKKRLETHNKGKGAKYTKPRLPCVLVWESLPFVNKGNALRTEYYLKRSSREWKVKLVTERPYPTGPVNHSMHFKP